MSNITCYDSDGNLLKGLYQWDYNQTIEIAGLDLTLVPVCHFCNRNSQVALVVTPTVSGSRLVVDVPNILLQEPEVITLYIYQDTNNDSAKTIHAICIPVTPRTKPDDYIYEDNIEYLSAAILNSRLNNLISELTDEASQSGGDVAPEVIDIRVGTDGTIYNSAGDAVRAIGTQLSTARTQLTQYIDSKAVDGLRYQNNLLYLTINGVIASDPVEITGGGGGGYINPIYIGSVEPTDPNIKIWVDTSGTAEFLRSEDGAY